MTPSNFKLGDDLLLGIDTGGTYTDSILWSERAGIIAKAKSLTTRHDLSVGIAESVDAVLAASGNATAAIKMVSMSTTLATNALVEGQGDRAAMVLIGFSAADLARNGLADAIGSSPVIYCPGGHDAFGNAAALDLTPLRNALPELAGSVASVAICARFAVRNPQHEQAAAALVQACCGLPITLSHQLSAQLGGPKRALTTFLNARLISMINRLIHATESFLASRQIDAPLMVVRGDGALMSASFAKARPIETILSGPAASVLGARHLTGLDNAIVADIGGTTTDVAILDQGRPRLDPEGARVGGFRTMVEAIAMHTFGLGGDSEVTLHLDGIDTRLELGPRRLIPLSLAETHYGSVITRELERQMLAPSAGRHDGRFVVRSGLPDALASGLSAADAALFAKISLTPQSLDSLITYSAQTVAVTRLVARGLVQLVGFTPSDAAHVVGRQSNWSANAARIGAQLFCRQKGGDGRAIADSVERLSEWVLHAVTRRSAEVILQTVFTEDGVDPVSTVAHPLVQRALDGTQSVAQISIALDRPVVGLGASAAIHHLRLPRLLNTRCEIPGDADVANALGAVVGQVRTHAVVVVSRPAEDLFRVASSEGLCDFDDEAQAIEEAERVARQLAIERCRLAGADSIDVSVQKQVRAAMIEDRRMFIDADITATAFGRPRIARH
jgi:N-methylhydantoinase A/oxoprolinase/acetone carboxylase beta subunit